MYELVCMHNDMWIVVDNYVQSRQGVCVCIVEKVCRQVDKLYVHLTRQVYVHWSVNVYKYCTV